MPDLCFKADLRGLQSFNKSAPFLLKMRHLYTIFSEIQVFFTFSNNS